MMYKDTLTCTANYYLDTDGCSFPSREHFLGALFAETFNDPGNNGPFGYMVYIGEDMIPLQIAVIAWSGQDAIDSIETWCARYDRDDDLEHNEDGEITAHLVIERIPNPIVVMPND